MKKIKKKNYIILTVALFSTLVITCYLALWYKNNVEYYKTNSIMEDFLPQLGKKDVVNTFNSFIIDNPHIVIYLSSGSDDSIKDFEKELKSLIIEQNIKSYFVYINIDDISASDFYNELQTNFFSDELKNINIKKTNQANLFAINDGKITDLLYKSDENISVSDVKVFLIRNGVLEND